MTDPITNIEYLTSDEIADEVCEQLEENGDPLIRELLGESWAVGPDQLQEWELKENIIPAIESHDMSQESRELLRYVRDNC